MTSSFVRAAAAAVFAAAAAVAAGCRDEEPLWGGPVSGAVTFEGRPLKSGAVTFIGSNGHAKESEVVDGKFAVNSPPMGPCQVTVMTAPKVDEMGKAIEGSYTVLPPRYADPKASGLTFTVTESPQTLDLRLTK